MRQPAPEIETLRPLNGVVVGIVERRFASQLTALFERAGARPDVVPLLEERLPKDRTQLHHLIECVVLGSVDTVVLTTGVGVRFLLAESEALGLRRPFVESLKRLRVVARGSKTVAALNKERVRIEVRAEPPTSDGIVSALRRQGVRGRHIGIQLYGTPNPRLSAALEDLGANVFAVQAYTYEPVSDRPTVAGFLERLLDGRIDVVAFTSATQVPILVENVGSRAPSSND